MGPSRERRPSATSESVVPVGVYAKRQVLCFDTRQPSCLCLLPTHFDVAPYPPLVVVDVLQHSPSSSTSYCSTRTASKSSYPHPIRFRMYSDCIASSSRLTMQDIWEPLPASMCFPVSDCRSESPLADLVSRRTNKPASKPSSPVSLFPSSYSTQLPRRWQVSPGVWTDGQSTLYSPALPEVQKLLADARESLTIPEPSSDLILTLAALEVFYRPSDPAHWMFWSDDKKSYTADVVTKIACESHPVPCSLMHSRLMRLSPQCTIPQ